MESVTEGVVVEWRVAVGEAVAVDQIVLEVSTDKVDLEVPAPAAGTLTSIVIPNGETFTVGQPLGEITTGATAGAAAPSAPTPSAPAAPAPAAAAGPAVAAKGADVTWPQISPIARRAALEKGIDPSTLVGSGPGGIVRKGDVVAAAAAPAAPAATPIPSVEGEEAVVLRGPAAALAGYMDESLKIPTATSFRTLSVAVLDAQRRTINADLKSAGRSEKLSFTHLIAWAIIKAVASQPVMGTGFSAIDGKPHKLVREAVNLGLAVDVERKDGSRSLLVPVVRDSAAAGFDGFRVQFDDLVGRTRAGQVKPDELRGATVTLTNPGGIGTIASVPRLMPGQGTIVATGAIGYPPGLSSVGSGDPARSGCREGHDHDQHLRPPGDPGRRERRLPRRDRHPSPGRQRLLRRGARQHRPRRRSADRQGAPPRPPPAPAPAAPVTIDDALLEGVAAAVSVVKAHRSHGHLAAHLDPLGSAPPGDPSLAPESVGLTPELMARIPASLLRVKVPGESFAAALPELRKAYCGTIAYEIEHLSDHGKRLWLRGVIESGRYTQTPSVEHRRRALSRLIEVDAFERFLRRTYLGQKTFSIEGVDALVSITDEVIELVGDEGADDVVMGMAHRGRLAFISRVVGRPPESILAEFEGHMAFESGDEEVRETAGDVKYHLGAEGTYTTRNGRTVRVKLAANPSHLEQVNAVAEGLTRALQTDRGTRDAAAQPRVGGADPDPRRRRLHRPGRRGGDVQPPGTARLHHRRHDPRDREQPDRVHHRPVRLALDVPRERPGARLRRARDPRQRRRRGRLHRRRPDRRRLPQPLPGRRADQPDRLPPPRPQRAGRAGLHAAGHEPHHQGPPAGQQALRPEAGGRGRHHEGRRGRADRQGREVDARRARGRHQPRRDRRRGRDRGRRPTAPAPPPTSAVPEPLLRELNDQLLAVPDGFTIHPKLVPQLARRRDALGDEGGIAWAHAESLAFASLLVEGVPLRLTGQDTARGTFSQRHLELHDVGEGETWTPHTGRLYTPLGNLPDATASLELHNSPLSEAAAVGFEYGYSTQAPEALVLWEAQYGDFVNGAQIMIDQFIVSGRAKWGEASRLTLLLPHGYEGNGPEHSSARIERFLQAAAEDNIRVANCSTAANYFHLLRKQALTERCAR